MDSYKQLYGETYLDCKDSEELSYGYKIDLSYYKTMYPLQVEEEQKIYGIEVIKKEWNQNQMLKTEKIEIENITNKEDEAERLLKLLKENKVTPITVTDVIDDIMKRH